MDEENPEQLQKNKAMLPRQSGRFVSKNATHVTIDAQKAKECGNFIFHQLKIGQLQLSELFQKSRLHPDLSNFVTEDFGVNWIFFADLLNFSFWNQDDQPQYEVTYKGQKQTGYLSFCAAINRTLDQNVKLIDPKFYEDLSLEDLNSYLMGDNQVPCPLIDLRLQCLQEASKVLEEKFGGSVINLVLSAQQSAQKLLLILTSEIKCFCDEAHFKGERVSLHKRAQIFISDLWSLYQGEGLGKFDDIDTLTMFADYRVPQSLQYFGVFQYSKELKDLLISNQLLENGSQMEVEIRGCSIQAVDMIVEHIRNLSQEAKCDLKVNDILIDYFFWNFRRDKTKEMNKFPYHKTRSIFY